MTDAGGEREQAARVLGDIGRRLGLPDQPADGAGRVEVWPLILDDMKARDGLGRSRYGRPLETHNGRDALRDLGEELLDAVVYCRQLREELKALGGDLGAVLGGLQAGKPEARAVAIVRLEAVLKMYPVLRG